MKISALEEEMVEGGGVTFECVVGGGHPRPEVVWLLNNNRYTTVEYVSEHCHPFSIFNRLLLGIFCVQMLFFDSTET